MIIRQKPHSFGKLMRSEAQRPIIPFECKQHVVQSDLNTEESPQSETAPKRDIIICCKSCQQIITKDEFSVAINGNHEHIQCNPYGITFIFRCFNQTWHCLYAGEPQSAHSWFPGFHWTLTLCESCTTHLGWKFSNLDGEVFWGLISERLISQSLAD